MVKRRKQKGKSLKARQLFRKQREMNVQAFDSTISHEGALFRFLYAQRTFRNWVDKKKKLRGPDAHRIAEIREVADLLDEARVIEVEDDFISHCTQFANKELGALKDAFEVYEHPRGQDFHDMTQDYVDTWTRSRAVPYPSRLPFPVTYFAFEGIRTMLESTYTRVLQDANMSNPGLVGFLLSPDRCYSFICGRFREKSLATMIPVREFDDTRWVDAFGQLQKQYWYYPRGLLPILAPYLVNWVFDHKTILDTPYGTQSMMAQAPASLQIQRRIPPAYYIVYMDDKVHVEEWWQRQQKKFAGKIRQSPGHRYDVRAHDRVKVLRGPLPLDDALREKLEKPRKVSGRKYRVFTETQPDADLAAILFKRGVRHKRSDEWMAILIIPIEHRVQGPLDKPYVPSVRKSRKHKKYTDREEL